MSYFEATGDVNRYQLLSGGVCYDLQDKKQVDKKICDASPAVWTSAGPTPATKPGMSIGNLPKWLLPVGVGVAVFLFFRMRSGPKQNPSRRRRRNPYTVVKKKKNRLPREHIRTADWISQGRSRREQEKAMERRRAQVQRPW